MKPYFAMGLFALYAAAIFLVRAMADQEFFRVTAMKKVWGRTRGIALHFLANVALPLVLGIVFLCRGVADFSDGEHRIFAPVHHQHALSHLQVRPAGERIFVNPEESIRNGEIAILLATVPARPYRETPRPESLAWDFVPEPVLAQ